MSDELEFLSEHSPIQLQELQSLLHTCSTHAPSVHSLQQIYGVSKGALVAIALRELFENNWTASQLSSAIAAVLGAKRSNMKSPCDLVLSGPEVAGIPTRSTHAVFHALIAEANKEVLLVGYVIHNATALLLPLAQKMQSDPDLKVWCCIDIRRTKNDHSEGHVIVQRFGHEFANDLWPWDPKPPVYYDPRSLAPWGSTRSSIHAKCVVIDRRVALVTSANFTDAAQHRNIEAGVLIRDSQFASRIAGYFAGLIERQELRLLQPN